VSVVVIVDVVAILVVTVGVTNWAVVDAIRSVVVVSQAIVVGKPMLAMGGTRFNIVVSAIGFADVVVRD